FKSTLDYCGRSILKKELYIKGTESIGETVIWCIGGDFALTIITNAITAVMKYHSKEQSKVLKLDKLQVISLNAGVVVVISAVKEIIKYFSQDMCTNYEL
ncbi:MAG: hypothetical protein MRQ13_05885, partial [Candidatus Midichloria sp.]|nr:hypothetical protein [Candidatus Midichloria sp.]